MIVVRNIDKIGIFQNGFSIDEEVLSQVSLRRNGHGGKAYIELLFPR